MTQEPVYNLKVVTPQGVAYESSVAHTLVPVDHGFVGVLANHASYLTSSRGGKMIVREQSGVLKEFKLGAGFFEVNKNAAIFLTHSCAPVN